MQKLVQLDLNPNILVSSNVLNYDLPEFIYIPINDNGDILVKKNDLVFIGTPIIKYLDYTVNATISGKVTCIKKINTIDGIKDAIIIKNNYKDKTIIDASSKRSLNRIKKNELDLILSSYKINLNNIDNLILNCIDDEPYVLSESYYLALHYEGYLELLDKLAKVYKINKIIIAVKSVGTENINKVMSNLGMYPNIVLEIVPNLFLLAKNKFLLKHLNLSNNSFIIKASNFYNIYNFIKRNRLVTNKLITITGDGVINPSVVNVKIGSSLKEILDNVIKISDNVVYVANGLMQGCVIDIDSFVITDDVDSILVMKKTDEKKEHKCINCGACTDICPVGINPILLSKIKYKEMVMDKCLKCGLCSYICPVNINFNKYIKGDKNE